MKTISLTEVETDFKSVIHDIVSGNELGIINDESEDMIAVIIPHGIWTKTKKRRLGTLQNRGSVTFEDDFSMTCEEFDAINFRCYRRRSNET